jgi:hypothetical protein
VNWERDRKTAVSIETGAPMSLMFYSWHAEIVHVLNAGAKKGTIETDAN